MVGNGVARGVAPLGKGAPLSAELRLRQLLPALLSTIAPALFYLRPSMGSYLLHPCSRAVNCFTAR